MFGRRKSPYDKYNDEQMEQKVERAVAEAKSHWKRYVFYGVLAFVAFTFLTDS